MKYRIEKLNIQKDLDNIMKIWLETNIDAHDFIDESYWKSNFDLVKTLLPDSDLNIYFEDKTPLGFIGVMDGHIAGIFINKEDQAKGIGKILLDFAKSKYSSLTLDVYADNRKAYNFYLKNGFQEISSAMDKENNRLEIRMCWSR